MARQMAVKVSPEFIAEFLKKQELNLVIDSEIPKNATFVGFFEKQSELIGNYGAGIDRIFYFIFEHDSFPERPEGAYMPLNFPTITKK